MVSMVGPVAHVGSGMHTGMEMEEGMGMVQQGSALDEDLRPALGRGTGIVNREKPVSNLVGPQNTQEHQGHGAPSGNGNKKRVPGFPQDMWMPMDKAVTKPETYGLRPGWSGAVQGMTTLVRVLPPEMYEKVMAMVKEGQVKQLQKQPASPHGGHSGQRLQASVSFKSYYK
jgi:hypothetical protein